MAATPPTNRHRMQSAGSATLRHDVSRIVDKLLRLGRLQWALVTSDLRRTWEGIRIAVLLGCSALVLTLAALPVLLAGAGLYIVAKFQTPVGLTLLATSGVALLLAIALARAAWRKMHTCRRRLDRSREELASTLATIRRAVKCNHGDKHVIQ